MITVSTASCSNRDPTLLLALIGLFIKGNTFTKATKWTDHIFFWEVRHVRVSCWSVWLSPCEAIISNAPKKQQMDCHEKCALWGNLEFSCIAAFQNWDQCKCISAWRACWLSNCKSQFVPQTKNICTNCSPQQKAAKGFRISCKIPFLLIFRRNKLQITFENGGWGKLWWK